MEHYKYFQNKECEYFPCHKNADTKNFNCLFCYCPLYSLAQECGGNFSYTKEGVKDCSNCMVPHGKNGYEHVQSHIGKILERRKEDVIG